MNLNDLFNEEKVRLDPKCWTGKKIGNPKTKMKGGVRVNNCVPAESVEEGLDEAVGGNYLYHATGGLKEILQSGAINAARGAQDSTKAQTKLPTVSTTRDWGYASGSNATAQEGGISRGAVIVLDRNAVEQKYKTLGTSQSRDNRGLAFPKAGNLKAGQAARSYDTDQSGNITKADADDVFAKGTIAFGGKPVSRQEVGQQLGQAKHDYYTPKVGGEFEEAVVVPKGSLPIRGTMVGFWVNPRGPLAKDPTIMNDPRRLDMVRPNQFVKAAQPQGVAEGLSEMDKSQTPPGRDGSNDSDAGKKEYTAKATTPEKVAKHGEKILNKELNKKQGVAGLDEAHHGSLLNPKKGQFASVIFQSQWDTNPQIDYYNNLDDAKFDTENASAHHGSVYAWNGARWVRKMSATERTGGGGGYGSWEENKQGVAEEYELAGVGVAYELGRRAYKERKTARDNPYSATREARKNDEWAKGLERGKHDANDARHFRSSVREQTVAEGLAQDEAEEDSGWRAEFVNEINYNTFEVKLTNTRSKESANFIVRPVDMVSYGPTLSIETMDVHDLQTGQTESWTNDDPAPEGPIAYAISGLFYDNKELQQKLQNIVDTHDTKGQDMMPGLEKRRSIGQEVDADSYVDSGEKTQAAMAKMKKGVAEKLGDNRPKLGSKRDAGKSVRKWRKSRGLDETDVAEDLTRRGFLRGLGAAAVAGAAGSALAGTNDLEFPSKVQKLHSDMMEKNPRYAKEHEALGIALARGLVGASVENNKRWYQKTAELLQKYGVKVNEGVAEGKPKEKEADYGDDYQDMVARMKKLAGLGPLKTVYDPAKRVYRNIPTAQQPKK